MNYRYNTLWRDKCQQPTQKQVVKVDELCDKMMRADIERDMRLRVNKLQRFQEYSDVSSDTGNDEETEQIIKESEDFLDLRRRLKHRRELKKR